MNDLAHRFDDEVRDALRAEAAGVEATDRLRAAIQADIAGRRRPRRTMWLVAAAGVLAVAGVGLALVDAWENDSEVAVTSDTTTDTVDADNAVSAFLDVMPDEVACEAGESLDLALYTALPAPEPPADLVDHLRADPRVASARPMASIDVAARVQEEDDVEIDPAVTPPVVLVDLVDPGRDEALLRDEMDDETNTQSVGIFRSVVVQADIGCLPPG